MSNDKPKRKNVTSLLLSDEENALLMRQTAIEDRGKGSIMRDAMTLYVIVKGAFLDLSILESEGL